MNDKVVLSLSGGMDSTTLLAYYLDKGIEVHPFMFRYGSKHNLYEQQAVLKITNHYGLNCPVIDLTKPFQFIQSNLMQSGQAVPEGHYNNANMALTVVPGRNSVFITMLAGIAESIGAGRVALGVHSGDHHIYPDCRPEYVEAMKEAMHLATDGKVTIVAPFSTMNKTSIIELGSKLQVPYELTRTCYKDQPVSCGRCGSCQERLEAFANNGIVDPIWYESRVLMEKK